MAQNYVGLAKRLEEMKKGGALSKAAADRLIPFKTAEGRYDNAFRPSSAQSGFKATPGQKKLLDNLIGHYGYIRKAPSAQQNTKTQNAAPYTAQTPAARNLPQSEANSQTPESFTEDDYREYRDKLDLAKFASRYGQFSFYKDLGYSDEEIDQLKLNYEAFCLGEQEIAALLSAGYITDKEAIEELEELYADESYTQLTEQNLQNIKNQANASAFNALSPANAPLNSLDSVNPRSPVNASAPANASTPQKSSASNPSALSAPTDAPQIKNLTQNSQLYNAPTPQNSKNVELKSLKNSSSTVDAKNYQEYNYDENRKYGIQNQENDTPPINPEGITASENIKNFIKGYEGFEPEPYETETGSGDWSIGYGHLIKDENKNGSIKDEIKYYINNPMSEQEAEELFEKDMEIMINTSLKPFLNQYHIWLTQQQFDAMVSFAYNMGQNSFSEKKIENSDDIE